MYRILESRRCCAATLFHLSLFYIWYISFSGVLLKSTRHGHCCGQITLLLSLWWCWLNFSSSSCSSIESQRPKMCAESKIKTGPLPALFLYTKYLRMTHEKECCCCCHHQWHIWSHKWRYSQGAGSINAGHHHPFGMWTMSLWETLSIDPTSSSTRAGFI